MKLFKTVATVILGLAISVGAAKAQQQNVTLRVASFAGPFGEALQKYAFDLFTKRTGSRLKCSSQILRNIWQK
jgi:spermidine/putrescine-binding protein